MKHIKKQKAEKRLIVKYSGGVDSRTKKGLMSQQEFHSQRPSPQSSRPQRFFTPTTAIHACDETDIML
jgi:hypothetical protein